LHDWRLSRDERTLGRYFDTSAFVANDPYTYGNAGRNLLEGPGTVNFDLAVYKYFQITEGLRLQFRAEAFNALNTESAVLGPGAGLGRGGEDRMAVVPALFCFLARVKAEPPPGGERAAGEFFTG